ncbi:hypothetical protein [Actinocrispum wychmicini]|uniref:GLTT repeat-containing protein n=1 Tax=Actinocrispum wychmicini TaxID=1213861 RepID=A0A4R2JW76_9PSEU|nr:hypothetical protein [Actinocrispum wychmicini]TCO64703.1 hypothetical protein EV192_101485 [Actinocrispum wychmicini]
MLKTIRRGVLLAAAAGVTLLGLGFGQASAALPALPALSGTGLPGLSGTGLPGLSGAGLPALSGASLPAFGATTPASSADLSAVQAPGVDNVDVAGLGSEKGAQLPGVNVVPKLSGTALDGVTPSSLTENGSLPATDKLLDGSALSSLDTMKTVTGLVPTLGVLKALPQLG